MTFDRAGLARAAGVGRGQLRGQHPLHASADRAAVLPQQADDPAAERECVPPLAVCGTSLDAESQKGQYADILSRGVHSAQQ